MMGLLFPLPEPVVDGLEAIRTAFPPMFECAAVGKMIAKIA